MSTKFKTGDVIGFAYNNVLGFLIRLFTFGGINHVALCIDEEHCIEASGKNNKIQIVKIEEALKRNGKAYLYTMKPKFRSIIFSNKFRFDEVVKHYANTRYGWISALKVWLDTYFKFIPFRNNKMLCCSALIAMIFFHSRIQLTQCATEYTPEELVSMPIFLDSKCIKE